MKIYFLPFFCLFLFSCQDNQKKKDTDSEPKTDIVVEYTPVYFSENAKADLSDWKEFISLQNKIYELRNTSITKLATQISDLEALLVNLNTSSTPQKLKVFAFENKLYLLENAVVELKKFINDLSYEEKINAVKDIFNAFNALKNQINAIYA